MMRRRHVPWGIATLAVGALLGSCDVYDPSLLATLRGGPTEAYMEGCGDGVVAEDEMCDTGIDTGQEGACHS